MGCLTAQALPSFHHRQSAAMGRAPADPRELYHGARTARYQKGETEQLLHTTHKINSKWINNLNMRAKTITLLEEKIGLCLCDLELGNDF